MFWFVTAIIIFIAAICVGIFLFVDGDNGPGISVLVGGAVLSVVLIFVSCISSVPTGHTGILTTFGRVENYTLDAGINFKAPWQTVIKMDNRVQKDTVNLACFSSDIQEVNVTYTINYQKKNKQDLLYLSELYYPF